jgi:hypothetical protein
LTNGTIKVSSTVPEPSFLLPLASVLLIGLIAQRFGARQKS